ncbi:MAG: hypothetical protein Q9M97_04460 [Candidatus Gracilibacteria bacterium]|nr:hypothetical protein [Candidatus Gracilibacteria bacterium]
MTTITFEEDVKITDKKISIYNFIDILKENNLIPEIKELKNINSGVLKDYNESLLSNSRINI